MGKKVTTIGVRVDDDLLAIILKIAEEEHRTPAATMRKLTLEALAARGNSPMQQTDLSGEQQAFG